MMGMKIGVAGCGRMGLPMAQAMASAGFDVTGYDVRTVDGLIRMVEDPQRFMADRTVLFSIVRDIAQTEDVLFGAQNFAAIGTALTHIVICSTLSPAYVRELRARVPHHIALVDAPMSGAVIAAQEKRLSFMLGGEDKNLDQLHPLFASMGKHFHRMGGFGAGMTAKVLNNLLAASSTAMTRLALDWAQTNGLDEDKLLALMHDSSGQTWFGSNFDKIEFARDGYGEDNSIGILKKDVESALPAAPDGADLTLPLALIDVLGRMTKMG